MRRSLTRIPHIPAWCFSTSNSGNSNSNRNSNSNSNSNRGTAILAARPTLRGGDIAIVVVAVLVLGKARTGVKAKEGVRVRVVDSFFTTCVFF